jgi:peptide/nickel transport system substrate-binding protein
MKKFRKLLALLLALAMVFSMLAACSSKDDTATTTTTDTATDTGSDAAAEDTTSSTDTDFGSGDTHVTASEADDAFVRQTAEGTLTIGSNTAIDGFNPIESQSPALRAVYDALIEIEPGTNELIPCLAESWEWSDDYLTCTFHLRDATFSDGSPITSQDVYYDLYSVAHSTSLASSYYEDIDFDASSCPDDKTFVMVLTEVYAQMEYTLATTWIYPQAFAEVATAEQWWNDPVTSGAYTVVENVDGAYTKLAAREDYWKGAAEAKDVTLKYFSDSTAEFIAYQSGELDVAMNILSSDAERIQRGEEKNTTLVITSAFDFKMLALCEYVEAFQNENVRKAVAYAIDRQACVDVAYGILATVQKSNMNDSASYYKEIGVYEYDPDKARELLAAEGYEDGDINLRMIVFNTTTDMLLAETIQAYLAAVGINVTVEGYIMPTCIPMLRDGEADITLTGTGGGAYDAAQLFDKIDENGTDLSTIIHDDELQSYIHQGSSTMDPEIRAEAYANAQQLMFDKCYSVPIANINNAYCYRSYIESFTALTGEICNPYYCHFAS